jgi:hypothetical protein
LKFTVFTSSVGWWEGVTVQGVEGRVSALFYQIEMEREEGEKGENGWRRSNKDTRMRISTVFIKSWVLTAHNNFW